MESIFLNTPLFKHVNTLRNLLLKIKCENKRGIYFRYNVYSLRLIILPKAELSYLLIAYYKVSQHIVILGGNLFLPPPAGS